MCKPHPLGFLLHRLVCACVPVLMVCRLLPHSSVTGRRAVLRWICSGGRGVVCSNTKHIPTWNPNCVNCVSSLKERRRAAAAYRPRAPQWGWPCCRRPWWAERCRCATAPWWRAHWPQRCGPPPSSGLSGRWGCLQWCGRFCEEWLSQRKNRNFDSAESRGQNMCKVLHSIKEKPLILFKMTVTISIWVFYFLFTDVTNILKQKI